MAIVRLFAQARQTAGISKLELTGDTVQQVLEQAVTRFGDSFAVLVEESSVWLNGSPTESDAAVTSADEIAILPPVSGG